MSRRSSLLQQTPSHTFRPQLHPKRIVVSGNGQVHGGSDQLAISQLGTGRIQLGDSARVTSGRDDRVAVMSWGLSEPPNLQLRTAIGGSAFVDGHVHADGVVSVSAQPVAATARIRRARRERRMEGEGRAKGVL